jgi:hypothetical protein
MSRYDEERLDELEKDMILGRISLEDQEEYDKLIKKTNGS